VKFILVKSVALFIFLIAIINQLARVMLNYEESTQQGDLNE